MYTNFATFLVQFSEPSGVEMNAHLVLNEKPSRQDQKLKSLSKHVQEHPQGWKKRWELAELLINIGHWEQAIDEYHQVIERQPQLIDVRLQLGKILQVMRRNAEAIEVFQGALPLSRNLGTRHHIYGLIAVCRGDSDKAITAFDLAAASEPDKIVHWLALGQVQMDKENPVGALRAFDQVLSINPNDIVALIHSYDALMAMGNVQEARERLQKLMVLAPDDLRVLQRQLDERCNLRLVSGEDGKQTKKIITSVLQQTSHGVLADNLLAYYHIYRGDSAKGVALLQQYTLKYPTQPSSWYYYGRCLFQTGEYETADEAMFKAYRLYAKDCEIYRALCEILPMTPPSQERGAKLALIVEEMLEQFPDRWSIWASAGLVLVECFNDFERGCSVSEQGTKLQPQLADAWVRHGRVLALAGKHQQAVEAFTQGWELLPVGGYLQLVPAALWLGESYQVLGDAEASQGWWEAACEGSEKLKAFHPVLADYWLGRALAELGDRLGAIQAYESALSLQLLYPARGEVEKNMQRLKDKRRKGYGG
ncbi:MAG: tetratricopeptide repeat protein [Gloeotrichia echinulata CP02]|jgi:tetratricopeptide (TPR) repeat protein